MRKIIIVLLIFTSLVSLNAEVGYYKEAPFLPVLPEVLGMGGANVASAGGYRSLFYNPAGFAMGENSLTLLSENMWMYMNPAGFAAINETNAAQVISDQVTQGGFGIGNSLGVGLVTGGLGIGGAMIVDASLYGQRNIMDLSGDATITMGFVGGYALKLQLAGMELAVGADLKPMYRVHAVLDNKLAIQMINSMISSNDINAVLTLLNESGTLSGVGVGVDIGAILKMSNLKLGLVIQDFANTRFNYVTKSFEDTFKEEVTGTPVEDHYFIPMNVSAGASFDIPLGPLESLIAPSVHADLRDVVGVFVDGRSPWTLLHFGAEAELFKFLNPLAGATVKAGFNQGYITFGLGAKLLFIDLNMAIFTRELGKHIGDRPNSGATFELAIRL